MLAFETEIRFKIEYTGTAVFGCARPCVLNEAKEEPL